MKLIELLLEERQERRVTSPGLCMDECTPDHTDFTVWCDLPIDHPLPHIAYDIIPAGRFEDTVDQTYWVRPECRYKVVWPETDHDDSVLPPSS